jgi:hypothetical protein
MSWQRRVAFPATGLYAYVPREVLVRPLEGQLARARDILARVRDGLPLEPDGSPYGDSEPPTPETLPDPIGEPLFGFVRFVFDEGSTIDVVLAVAALRAAGIYAQPNHVVFADTLSGANFSGNPFSGNNFSGNNFSGNPFSGTNFSGNNFSGNNFSGNNFSGNPFQGNPFTGTGAAEVTYGKPHPLRDRDFAAKGEGPCLARPIDLPDWLAARAARASGSAPRVAVLDVPLPEEGLRPPLLAGVVADVADGLPFAGYDPADPAPRGFLDRAAGHGMFVAGRILGADPAADVTVFKTLENDGDGQEWKVMELLRAAAGDFDVFNLSFGGYALEDMAGLRAAVTAVQTVRTPASRGSGDEHGAVVVASAGNDATWLAPYPAAFDGVVGVAALGPNGPAAFTNYGGWVRACAGGVDVPSAYFTGFSGLMHPEPVRDPDDFDGAATWSGTSFAAPLVAGRLARLVRESALTPRQAAARLLDDPGLARIPGLGTVVTT